VPAIAQAVEASTACKVYVCNVATQRGETEGYSVADHVDALRGHVGRSLFPVVLANDNLLRDDPLAEEVASQPGVGMVVADVPPDADYRVVTVDLVDREHPWRHDSKRLARALLRHLETEAGT